MSAYVVKKLLRTSKINLLIYYCAEHYFQTLHGGV
jgi:hypothetical protein